MKEKYNILIVDDEDSTLERLKEDLSIRGYGVDLVDHGQKALEKIRQDKYHIILIHIERPDMDGIELLKAIKNYDSLAQVIMMSSDSDMNKILSALEYGANDYIHKSVNHELILELIDFSVQKLERWRKAMIHLIQ